MIICLGTTPSLQRVMVFKKLTLGVVNRSADVLESLAGKSTNVAKVLKTLGAPVAATGFAGGERGAKLRWELDRRGIEHQFVDVVPETRLCVTIIDESADQHTELVEETKQVEEEAWDKLREILGRLLKRATMLTLSGTLTPGGPVNFYAECVKRAREMGIPSIVDATGKPLLATLAEHPAIVKPNRAELASTLGITIDTEASLKSGMRRMLDLGAGAIMVTTGPEGALAADDKRLYRARIPKVKVINSIGSGDACAAGLAAALTSGKPFHDALKLSMACGVANAMTLLAAEVKREEVDKMVGRVEVEELGW
jgi:tagatose 6-phosphate kinase